MPQLSLPILRPAVVPAWLRAPSWRVLGVLAAVVVVLAGGALGTWLWFSAREHRGLESFADAMVKLQASRAPDAAPGAKAQAIQELEATLNQRPPASVLSQVTYELGNLKYLAQQYPESRSAYEMASASKSPTVSRLAQTSLGYTWEAQKDYPKAIEAFERAVASLKPGDFFYDELLVDLARVQELAGQRDAAIKTYRKVLENPASRRVDDVRARLAALGVKP